MLFLTPSRGLQDQLDGEFDTVSVVKGRSNYYCPEFKGGCDLPSLLDSICSIEKPGNGQVSRCQYRVAIDNASESLTPCGNYAFWFSLARYGDPNALGDFDLLVCDEAHSILDTLTEFAALTLKPEDLRLIDPTLKLPRFTTTKEWSEWARTVAFQPVCKALALLDSRTPAKSRAKITTLGKAITTLTQIGLDDATEYERWIPDARALDIKISPLWPGGLAEALLFRDIPRILLCSGSLTPEIIADLGIDPKQSEFIEVASTSPASNRPVIYLSSQPEIKVEHSMSSGEKRAIVKKVDNILDIWGEYKTIILSTSYDWCDTLQLESRYGRGHSDDPLLITHDRGKVSYGIDKFRQGSRGVLVSPALWEGYDFPECACLIFLKIPFMDSRDPLLSARKKARKGFANSLIAARLLQGSMRHIRSHTDRGVTFILDWHWTHFRNTAFFPQYYRRAWRVSDRIPTPKEIGL